MKYKKILLLMPAMFLTSVLVGCGDNQTTSKVRITFSPDYENATITTVEIDKNTKVSEPTDKPSRDGYTFDGWRVEPDDSSNKYNFDNNVSSDLILYGSWIKNTPTPSSNILSISNYESSYYLGQKLDLEQIKVNEIDSEGKLIEVDPKNLEFSYTDAFKELGTKTITVKNKLNGAKGAFSVNVLNDYEVDLEKYGSAMYKLHYGNVMIDARKDVVDGEDQYQTKFTYKRNGRKESLDEKCWTYYLYYNNDYYVNVFPCVKDGVKTAVVDENYWQSESLFSYMISDSFNLSLEPLWRFDNFKLNDDKVYHYEYSGDAVDYSYKTTYDLTFKYGELVKIVHGYQEIDSSTLITKYSITDTLTTDFSFSDEIYKTPLEMSDISVADIVFSDPEEIEGETKKYKATISNFVRYIEEEEKPADDSKLIDVNNLTYSVWLQGKNQTYTKANVTITPNIETVEEKKVITLTFDFTNAENGDYYCYYQFLGGYGEGYITIE